MASASRSASHAGLHEACTSPRAFPTNRRTKGSSDRGPSPQWAQTPGGDEAKWSLIHCTMRRRSSASRWRSTATMSHLPPPRMARRRGGGSACASRCRPFRPCSGDLDAVRSRQIERLVDCHSSRVHLGGFAGPLSDVVSATDAADGGAPMAAVPAERVGSRPMPPMVPMVSGLIGNSLWS